MTEKPLQITDEVIEKQKAAAATMRGVASAAQSLLAREETLSAALKDCRALIEDLRGRIGGGELRFKAYRFGGDGDITVDAAFEKIKARIDKVL